jgi:uncharacterized protein YjiS (DUF1127 family)
MSTNTIPMGAEFRAEGARIDAGAAGKGGLLTLLRGSLEALGRLRQRRRAINQLSRMSDGALLDIGVARDRIPDVVDGLIARDGPGARR